MTEKKRYLLGHGQELFAPKPFPKMNPGKAQVYTLEQAKNRLIPQLEKVRKNLAEQNHRHCHNGLRAVGVTVHPSYISKTSAPSRTLRAFGFDLLGSTGVHVDVPTPLGLSKKVGMRLYLAGDIESWDKYTEFARSLTDSADVTSEYDRLRREFTSLEVIAAVTPEERIGNLPTGDSIDIEILLHKGSDEDVFDGFSDFLHEVGVDVDLLRIVETTTLIFIPVNLTRRQLAELSKFSHVRFIRSAATLRTFRPTGLSRSVRLSHLEKPAGGVESTEFRVAIFDGGISHGEFNEWVEYADLSYGSGVDVFMDHGENVTSSFLFGHSAVEFPALPPCKVDHYRVLAENDCDPYRVLNRIVATLQSKDYQFANVSMGPRYAISDDHLDPWTVALDEVAQQQSILICVAAGNDGDADRLCGNHRIQPPSDGVNVLGVGAVDRHNDPRAVRADYSSFGPGRCPGLVKPDAMVFGGSAAHPFAFIKSFSSGTLAYDVGTSFASPLLLRLAAGVRGRIQSEDLTPLAIKALMVHHCERESSQAMEEFGWGILADLDPEKLITCEDGEVKVIYQGFAQSKKIVRTPIPLPDILSLISSRGIKDNSKAKLRVTLCISSGLNPADAANYTRVGVSVIHRARSDDEESTRPLFTKKVFKFGDESVLRHDSHKWGTTIVGSDSLELRSWNDPVLDFHFQDRDRIGDIAGGGKIPFAIVVSVRIPAIADLYELVKDRYRKLEPVRSREVNKVRNQA